MSAPLCYSIIENVAQLKTDYMLDEFVKDYYTANCKIMNGIVKHNVWELRLHNLDSLENSMTKYASKAKISNNIGWTMYWYELRTSNGDVWYIDSMIRGKLMCDFTDISKKIGLNAECFIIQESASLLIAVVMS